MTDNELIAEFMGWERLRHDSGHMVPNLYPYVGNSGETEMFGEEMEFHRRWDWLMPVVEKIEHEGFPVDIWKNCCLIRGVAGSASKVEGSKINAVYSAVVEFIKWYN